MENKKLDIQTGEVDIYEIFIILKKRAWLIFIVFVIAILLVLTANHLIAPTYKGSFMIKSYVISPIETTKIIYKLDELIKEDRFQELAESLQIEQELAKQLSSLSVHIINEDKNLIEITEITTSQILIKKLPVIIVSFLEKNQFVSSKLSLVRERDTLLVKGYQEKIKNMESIQFMKSLREREIDIKAFHFNPFELDRTILELEQRKIELEINLKSFRGFDIVTESSFPVTYMSNLKKNLVIAVLIASIMNIFVIVMIESSERRKRISE